MRWEEAGLRNDRKCASHSPRCLLPIFFFIFFFRSNQQGTARAFADVTQPLFSAAESSSSRPAEDDQGGERGGGGGGGREERRRDNAWTDAKRKKNINHKNKNSSLPSWDYCTWEQAVGVEVDDRQEETRWTLQSCGDNFASALWIRQHQAKASYMCRKSICYLASDDRPAKCLSASKDGL